MYSLFSASHEVFRVNSLFWLWHGRWKVVTD